MKRQPVTGCRAESLFGLWFIEPAQHAALVELAKGFDLRQLAALNAEARAKAEEIPLPADDEGDETAPTPADADKAKERLPYLLRNGVAVLDIIGPTTKYPTSFQEVLGGTSTLMATLALRHAARNGDVRAVLLHLQSPGGTVDGAFDFVDEIRRADAAKPVYAHVSDQGCSCAMLFACQCRRVTANRNAHLGSIGVRTQLVDTSEGYKQMGVRVIPIASGRYKAVGAEGVPVTKGDEAYVQGLVDKANDLFVADVAGPRRLTPKSLYALQARVLDAAEALSLNLIDAVANFDDVLDDIAATKAHPPARGAGPGAVRTMPAA